MNMNGQADENWLSRKSPQSQLEAVTVNKPKPLSDEEYKAIFFKFCESSGTWRDFKRAIEERILGK